MPKYVNLDHSFVMDFECNGGSSAVGAKILD